MATGKPTSQARATASSAECAGRLRTIGMPNASSISFESAGLSHSCSSASAASITACARARSGAEASSSGSGACSSSCWFEAYRPMPAIASTAVSGRM